MRNVIFMALVVLLTASCKTSQKSNSSDATDAINGKPVVVMNNFKDTISYLIGNDIARSFKTNKLDLNIDLLFAGITDGMNGSDTMFSQQQFQELMGRFQKEMQMKQQQEATQAASGNKEKGRLFLETNKAAEGVLVTASGLQYKVLRPGTGPKPSGPTAKVKVHYEGRLIDGTIFDSSYERNEPITFGLDQVIKGWTEGLQLMNVGSMYELYIPSELGYGDRNMGTIPPGSTLIFKVELLDLP